MATQQSIEKAAQAWCDPKTSHLVMEPDLAYVFAEMLDELKAEIEQLHVQLAGCSVAALGNTSEGLLAVQGDYGWSVPYQDVLELRLRYDKLKGK